MIYRTLGRSGLKVSCVGVGGNIFGRFCGKEETGAILRSAAACGINLIDTADVYSEGESERLIGECVAGSRSSWVIATKLGLRSDESYRGRACRERIAAGIEASLVRLRTDYVDLYQVHHFDSGTPLEETLGALDALKRQGKVRAVGASNYFPAQLSSALKISDDRGFERFTSMQCVYNLFKREAEAEMLPLCAEAGMGFLAYATLARGVLSGKYRPDSVPPEASRATVSVSIRGDLAGDILSVAGTLKSFAESRGLTASGLALAWVLRRPDVSAAIVGVRDSRQLTDTTADIDKTLTPSELREVERLVGDLRRYESYCLGDTAAAGQGRH